jgi:pilus assembly protein CpaB
MIRIVFFALMAFGLVGFGTVAWIATRPPPGHAVAKAVPVMQTVLVAAHPIRAGSLLKPEDLAGKPVTIANTAENEFNPDTPDARRALMGGMVRHALAAGDPLRNSDVMRPGDHGFLAAVLLPGMRAVTITVDSTAGTGGLIGPGDRVDLILTQALSAPNLPAGKRIAAETALSNVRVLAIDQQLVQDAAPAASDNKNRSVTLEVTEEQAERLSVAMQLGHLSLSVRSADPSLQAAAPRAKNTIWALDVSPALGADPAPPPGGAVRVFPGTGEVKEFKY